MIIHDFNLAGVALTPQKADPPLFIDANAVPAFAVAFERFQVVARRHGQLLQLGGRVQEQQFASGAALKVRREAPGQFGPEDPLGFGAREVDNTICAYGGATLLLLPPKPSYTVPRNRSEGLPSVRSM